MRDGDSFWNSKVAYIGRSEHRKDDTGYTENWAATLGYAMDTELSMAEAINSGETMERNNYLKKLVSEDKIDFRPFIKKESMDRTEFDWSAMADHAKSIGFNISNDEELFNSRQDTLQERKSYVDEINSRANMMGGLGMFSAYAHNAMVDPINIAAMTVGPVALAKHMGATASVIRAGTAEAGLAVGSEIPIQIIGHDWRDKVGVDYTWQDSIIEIAATGLLAGSLTGAARALGKWSESDLLFSEAKTIVQSMREEYEQLAKIAEFDNNPERTLRQMEKLRESLNTFENAGRTIPAGKPRIKLKVPTDDRLEASKKALKDEPIVKSKDDNKVSKEGLGKPESPKLDLLKDIDPELESFMGEEAIGQIRALQNKVNRLTQQKKAGINKLCDL